MIITVHFKPLLAVWWHYSCDLTNFLKFFANFANFFFFYLRTIVKKAFCYQKWFWPFTVWINCSSDLKKNSNSRPSASNFKSFSRSLEHFFLTAGFTYTSILENTFFCTCTFTLLLKSSTWYFLLSRKRVYLLWPKI